MFFNRLNLYTYDQLKFVLCIALTICFIESGNCYLSQLIDITIYIDFWQRVKFKTILVNNSILTIKLWYIAYLFDNNVVVTFILNCIHQILKQVVITLLNIIWFFRSVVLNTIKFRTKNIFSSKIINKNWFRKTSLPLNKTH